MNLWRMKMYTTHNHRGHFKNSCQSRLFCSICTSFLSTGKFLPTFKREVGLWLFYPETADPDRKFFPRHKLFHALLLHKIRQNTEISSGNEAASFCRSVERRQVFATWTNIYSLESQWVRVSWSCKLTCSQ